MKLYEGSKTRVRVDSELSEEFMVKAGMHQGSVLSPFCFVDVTEFAKEGVLWEFQHSDGWVLMRENRGTQELVQKMKEVIERKNVHFLKTMLIVSGGLTMDWLFRSVVCPCEICYSMVNGNSVLCVECCEWIHSRCAGVKTVTQGFQGILPL